MALFTRLIVGGLLLAPWTASGPLRAADVPGPTSRPVQAAASQPGAYPAADTASPRRISPQAAKPRRTADGVDLPDVGPAWAWLPVYRPPLGGELLGRPPEAFGVPIYSTAQSQDRLPEWAQGQIGRYDWFVLDWQAAKVVGFRLEDGRIAAMTVCLAGRNAAMANSAWGWAAMRGVKKTHEGISAGIRMRCGRVTFRNRAALNIVVFTAHVDRARNTSFDAPPNEGWVAYGIVAPD